MVITSILLCTTFTAFWGNSPFSFRFAPKGNCSECCPINLRQDVTFHLFTRKNYMRSQRLILGNVSALKESNLNPKYPIIIYVHGFTEQINGKASTTVKNAYLKKGLFNVILVDWSPLAAFPWYSHSVINTRIVGMYLAKFIEFLIATGNSIKNIHLIGFSLGAEIAGFTGKDLTRGKLPRITGLDAAYPLYMFTGKRGHLSSSDAEFVDVIHTDGGIFGFPVRIGDADFFPNGGFPPQPGCPINVLLQRNQISRIISCSHDRAWQYYAESVLNEKGFPAVSCSNYETFKGGDCDRNAAKWSNGSYEMQYMGYAVNNRLKGKFYLRTNDREPFARNNCS